MTQSAGHIAAVVWLCLCATTTSLAQSTSAIGSFLQPGWSAGQSGSHSGLWIATGLVSMTRDGEWIAFVENDGAACDSSAYDERISMMRTDGTGHRVIVDWPVLKALQPGQARIIQRIRLSPEGRRLYFEQQTFSGCDPVGYHIPFGVDVATGEVELSLHQGEPAYLMSYTDDGRRVVFWAFAPDLGSGHFFISDPGLEDPRPFLDVSRWWSAFHGKLSGNGSKFIFIVWHGSLWGDVFVMDMSTAELTKVTPKPLPLVYSADISADGSRVVFGHSTSAGALYAVESDGSGLRQISEGAQANVATLSRDGEVIYARGWTVHSGVTSSGETNVYQWKDGALVGQFLGGGASGGPGMGHMAITADGSLVACRQGLPPVGLNPLMIRTNVLPAVTTYGFGDPDTPIHWDVCAAAGSDWVLAASLRKGLLPLPGVGDLLLSPEHLFVLDAGTISGPYNASTVTREIPVDAALPEVLPLHSQALVVSPEGEARLTNRTTFELHGGQAAAADVATSPNGSERLADTPAQGVPRNELKRRPSLWELSPAERLRRMELMDPSIAWRRERGLLPAGSP